MIAFVKGAGGIEYAKKVMNDYFEKALSILDNFPDSAYKKSLGELVRFTIERTK